RARPTVREQERHWTRTDAGLVDEVQVDAADRRGELAPSVELGLLGAPVVAVAPVGDERFHVGEVGAVPPRLAGNLVRPAHPGGAVAQIFEDGAGDADRERTGLGHERIIDVGDPKRSPASHRYFAGAQLPKLVPADEA